MSFFKVAVFFFLFGGGSFFEGLFIPEFEHQLEFISSKCWTGSELQSWTENNHKTPLTSEGCQPKEESEFTQ